MTSETRTTTDHDEIRAWAAEHGGTPATVAGTPDDGVGVLRIDFLGGAGPEDLEQVSWGTWFDRFEDDRLAFVYQQQRAPEEDSTFFKLTPR